MTDRATVGWTLCGLSALLGTYLAFVRQDLLWGSTFILLGCLGYFGVLGRAMTGRWRNFKQF